jgi:hypothetical protein
MEYGNDTVLKAILHDFERLVRPEAITDKNPWLLMRPCFGLGFKHTFEPVQAEFGVGVSRFRARMCALGS